MSSTPCHIEVAATQVGVVEDGKNNHGEQVAAYLASVGFKEGAPWCGALPHWCYRECGRVLEPKRSFALAANWHPKERRVWQRSGWKPDTSDTWTPISIAGDHAALWYTSLNPARIGHTMIVYKEDKKYLYTIEGNTNDGGSRDGDGVYRRRRLKRSIYCVSRW